MNRRIVQIFFISFLMKGLFSSCNQQQPNSIESKNDTLKIIPDTISRTSDTLPSIEPKKYTDVHCMLLINYPKISNGEYVYKKYSIIKDKSEFRIEREYRNKSINHRVIPFTKEEQEFFGSIKDSTTQNTKATSIKLGNFNSDNYASSKETYTVNNIIYTVYKHIDYNCYDPFCGTKHGHTTHEIGVTYFSPEYGILVSKDEASMEYELLASIKEREVPYDLIIDIMKQNKMDERIINTYIRNIRTLQSKSKH